LLELSTLSTLELSTLGFSRLEPSTLGADDSRQGIELLERLLATAK